MKLRKCAARVALAVCAACVPMAALAMHGKPGLWEITTHMNMSDMMARIPPDQLARMRAMGMRMPNGQAVTTQYCLTAAEVANDKPPPMHMYKDCALSNVKYDAHSYAADATCAGAMTGQGHVSVAMDGEEHYAGSYVFKGAANGQPVGVTSSFEGRWISADCGTK